MKPVPGTKSSEFWLILVAIVCFTVLQALDSLSEEFLLAVSGMVAAYTGGRSFVKGKQAETAGEAVWPPPVSVNVQSPPPPPPS